MRLHLKRFLVVLLTCSCVLLLVVLYGRGKEGKYLLVASAIGGFRRISPANNNLPKIPEPPFFWSPAVKDLYFDCRHGPRQIPFITNRTKIVAIFIEKPVFLSLRPYFKQKHYSVRKIAKMDSVADYKDLVPQPDIFPVIFASPFAFGFEYLRDIAANHLGMTFTVRFSFKFPGNKTAQLQAFRRQFNIFGCNFDKTQLMPETFILQDPGECSNFFKYCKKYPNSKWVLKPEHGFGGEGITLHSNITGLKEQFGLCGNSNELFIVQRYIPNLLLLNDHKFDVRGLLLIASTVPFLLFYHDGYLRVTLKPFSHDLSDLQSHLTNTHYQSQMKTFTLEEHLWTFDRFQKYLQVHHPDRRYFVMDTLVPTIKKYGRFFLGTGG